MLPYVLRRLALMPVTLIGLTLLVFVITRYLPGGPLDIRLAQETGAAPLSGLPVPTLSDEQLQSLKQYYGLDRPLFKAYAHWLLAITQGDLGVSLRYHESVWSLIGARLPVSLLFGLTSLFCSFGLCVFFGIISAYRPQHILIRGLQGLLLLAYAIPTAIMAMLLFFFIASKGYMPIGGLTSDAYAELNFFEKILDVIAHATLPLLAYGLHQLAVFTFILKDGLREQLASDAVRMARAKGATAWQALLRHALPLAILPIVTQLGHQISFFLGSSLMIEHVFNLNGFGRLSFEAMTERDYPLVIGLITLAGFLHVLGNLLSDLCLAWADPRIRLGRKEAS